MMPTPVIDKDTNDFIKVAIAFVIGLVLLIYYRNKPENKKLFYYALLSIFITSIVLFGYYFVKNIHPKEWDFTCFYLFGKVARYGMNFYNSADYYQVLHLAQIPFVPSEEFRTELLDVGCLYPPPSLFMFLPLGYMNYTQALYFTYFLILLATIGSIYMFKQSFFKEKGFEGWIISTILILLFPPLLSTVKYAQTLVFLLFLLLLTYYFRNKPVSGFSLAIAIIVKPFVLIILLYYIFTKQWKAIIYFVFTSLIIVLISVLYFGISPFIEYIVSNPSKNLPEFWYSETTNQSLLAELYRTLGENWILAHKVYYMLAIMITVIAVYPLTRLYKYKTFDLIIPLLLSLSLIIYPNGQVYYPIVHILSVFIIIKYLPNFYLKTGIIFIFYISLTGNMLIVNFFILALLSLLLAKPIWEKYVKIPDNDLIINTTTDKTPS